jgi:uncharacterized Fe-S cluster-containing radical SAM superfamily protein
VGEFEGYKHGPEMEFRTFEKAGKIEGEVCKGAHRQKLGP